jgi:hypothetical protein
MELGAGEMTPDHGLRGRSVRLAAGVWLLRAGRWLV